MTKALFLVVQICAGCAFALAAAQTPRPTQSGSEEATLMQFERDQSNAWGKGDSAALDRMLAADFVFTDYEGQVHTKAQILADLKSGAVKPGSNTVSEMKPRMFGDVAIVHGVTTWKGIWEGKEASGQYRWTDVLAKRGGRWQVVSTHVSKVVQR